MMVCIQSSTAMYTTKAYGHENQAADGVLNRRQHRNRKHRPATAGHLCVCGGGGLVVATKLAEGCGDLVEKSRSSARVELSALRGM